MRNNPAMATGMAAQELVSGATTGLKSLHQLQSRFCRLIEVAVGMGCMKIIDICFDYFLYPFVICRLGILSGFLLMTLLDFIACFFTVLFYDWSKRDWFGIEELKSLVAYEGGNRILRFTSRLLKKSNAIMFLLLSVRFDAFVTMVYFRHGAFNGMDKRDWGIFRTSILLSNLFWSAACFSGASLLGGS